MEMSAALAAAVDEAGQYPPCTARAGATGEILSEVYGDLGVDQMASIGFVGENGVPFIASGMLFMNEYPMVTDRDDALASTQAKLFMNHQRVLVTFGVFTMTTSQWGVARGDWLSAQVSSPEDWADLVYAEWMSGQELVIYSDTGTERLPLNWSDLVRAPVRELAVDDAARREAWDLIDGWLVGLEGVVNAGDWRSVADLEPLAPELETVEAVLCVLLGTEYVITEEAVAPHSDDAAWLWEYGDVFYRELAVQEALVAIEYAYLLTDGLAKPEIDWLRGESVDASQDPFDDTTDTSEYVVFWLDGMRDALTMFRMIEQDAPEL